MSIILTTRVFYLNAALSNRQLFRVERNGVCLLIELEVDLDGPIICEFLDVNIVNREIVMHRLDTTLEISSYPSIALRESNILGR